MEVASIITPHKSIVVLFEDFILNYSKLQLREKDHDTIYFSRNFNEKLEIYYHFLLNNVQEEFSYNYKEDDIKIIREQFKDLELYIFDLSFRNNSFFIEMMIDFKTFLCERGREYDERQVLISHPFNGIIALSDIEMPPSK